MAVPEKYLVIMSKFQKALKTEDFSEVDLITLDDLKLASSHLVKDQSTAYYHLLQSKIAEKELIASHKNFKNGNLVFISYDTRDIELVKAIDDILQRVFNKKVITFIAKRDIQAGDDAFKKMLHESLAKCAIVLAICTKRSITSPWLWFESGAGFQKAGLIPVWSGVAPQEFKAPMTIFQGKNIQDKTEIEELLTKIAEVTGAKPDSVLIREDELATLVEISNRIDLASIKESSTRIEDKIEFPFPTPPEKVPVAYLIEASFPLSENMPKQRLLKCIQKSIIEVPSSESKFGFNYPDIEEKVPPQGSTYFMNCQSVNSFVHELRQVTLIKSEMITFTHWVRNFRLDTQVPLINGDEINHEAAMVFTFFNNIAAELQFLIKFNMRIRLFGLQNSQLVSGKFFERNLNSFRAPATNDIEVTREIKHITARHDFTEMMMEVWEKFQLPNGKFPIFKDTEFQAYLQLLEAAKTKNL